MADNPPSSPVEFGAEAVKVGSSLSTAGGPPSHPAWPSTPMIPSIPGTFSKDLQVAPDQVVAVASLFDSQFEQLNKELQRSLSALKIHNIAADQVSVPVMRAWNQLAVDDPGSYVAQLRQYLQSLKDVIDRLRDAANKYHLIDDKNKEVFKDRKVA